MDQNTTGKLVGRIALLSCLATALMMGFGYAYTQISGVTVGAHGWIAMLLGTSISFAVAGTLTTILVMGRRSGVDKAATEIEWE